MTESSEDTEARPSPFSEKKQKLPRRLFSDLNAQSLRQEDFALSRDARPLLLKIRKRSK